MRCFAFAGEGGEVGEEEIDGAMTKVWRAKKAQKVYLSINATSLDAGQEGLDLREWCDKSWIFYLDAKDHVGDNRFGMPHEGGMY